MTMVPQYSQLLDVLGIMQSGVMSKAMTIDQALADGQSRAEAAMAAVRGTCCCSRLESSGARGRGSLSSEATDTVGGAARPASR